MTRDSDVSLLYVHPINIVFQVARAVGNQAFNDIMEANLTVEKPAPDAAMSAKV